MSRPNVLLPIDEATSPDDLSRRLEDFVPMLRWSRLQFLLVLRDGPLDSLTICETIDVSRNYVYQQFPALIAAGLIQRVATPEDDRRLSKGGPIPKWYGPTARGLALLEALDAASKKGTG